jgi:mycofactocin precursor
LCNISVDVVGPVSAGVIGTSRKDQAMTSPTDDTLESHPVSAPADQTPDDSSVIASDTLVEEVSIDGMCGVY